MTPTIAEMKEHAVPPTPVFLFDCTLPDGTHERWCTHRVEIDDAIYEPRVLAHNLFEMRAGSDDGVDGIHRLSLVLANADSVLSQITRSEEWKNCLVTVTFVFYDLLTHVAVTESVVVFRGIADQPYEITEATVRLSVSNRMSASRLLIPDVRIQRRCPWMFPASQAERTEAVSGGTLGKYSPFFRCGYSADIEGGRGNLEGAAAFTFCNYTRAHCVERGMYDEDSGGQATRRFGGIEYVPASTLVRGHGDAGGRLSAVVDNVARYNDFVPVVYGTAWVQAPVVTAKSDGNLTRMEVLLGCGEINGVLKVVVNDVEIPAGISGHDMTGTGWYNVVTTGTSIGAFNLDYADRNGLPLGDPYGSIAYLSVVVPNRVSEGRSAPKVSALVEGLRLPIYDGAGEFVGEEYSNNPAWILLDLLRRSGWSPGEINLSSFAAAGAYCSESVEGADLFGNPAAIPRYACNLVVRRRRSVGELIKGVRNCAGLYLVYGGGGLLEVRVEERLAIQQAVKPDGSNASGQIDGGWPAYEFGDGTNGTSGIARRPNGESSVRLSYRSRADSPNRCTVEFQDEFNDYGQDSLSLVDIADATRAGHEISATLPALGVANFHQAARLLKRYLDKSLRGGLVIEFETSVRAVGLRPGDLIAVTYLKEGLVRQLFRITRIAAGLNHFTALIEARIHSDSWYTDAAEGSGEVARRQGQRSGVPRPLVGTALDESGIAQFGVAEEYVDQSDGTVMVRAALSFVPPAKPQASVAGIPQLSLSADVTPSGGSLAGGQTVYYAISGVDANGDEGDLSFVVPATLPSSTNSNQVQLKGLKFPAGAATFRVYRGPNPEQLARIATEVPLAGTFDDTGLEPELSGPPDGNYDHAKFEWRLELLPLVEATEWSVSEIGNDSLEMVVDEYAGKVVRIHEGKGSGQERVITANGGTNVVVVSPWSTSPDSTSKFVIVESNWQFGGTGASSPVEFAIPNRGGATVQFRGVAVSGNGVESATELSPVTRWQIGFSGGGTDAGTPAAPVFAIAPKGRGVVEVAGIGFTDLSNTSTIGSGTLTMHFWDESNSPTLAQLVSAIDDEETEIGVDGASPQAGDLLQIGAEIVEVDAVEGSLVVRRGSHGSAVEAHDEASPVYVLDRRAYIIPFPRSFFGSPASGSFGYPITIPGVRLAAADLFMTNARGNGETGKVCFTSTVDEGVRTYTGGQITIQVEGHLAIQTAAAPPLVIEQTRPIRDIFAVVAQPPTGAPIDLQLRIDDSLLCALSIAVGETTSEHISGFGLLPLPVMSRLTLDVVSVGFGIGTTPGQDLTVTVRL